MAVTVALPLAQQAQGLVDVPARRPLLLVMAAVLGAVIPDLSLVAMIALGAVREVPASVIFDVWYFNDFWQGLSAVSNSIPLYAGIALLSWASIRSSSGTAPVVLLTLGLAALMHCLTDLPLHHDDGRPHFWPLTRWIFESPVSYWDSRHYGNIWSVIEIGLASGFAFILWRRYHNRFARTLIVITAVSLLAVASVWTVALS